jgi:hypothetical protein
VLAERALAAAHETGDAEAEVSARHALGWAQYILGDARSGRATLARGIRLAKERSLRRGEGLLRRHLAFWLAVDGDVRAAQREIAAALGLLNGLDRARSQAQRIEIHRMTSASDPESHRRVCADAAAALRVLRREHDEIWEAWVLQNRGLLFLDRGDLDKAEADLARARQLFEGAGAAAVATDLAVKIAEVALLRGDVLAALRTLEEAQPSGDDAADSLEYGRENLDECRVRTLVQARLIPEARTAAEAWLRRIRATGRRNYVPIVMLDLAGIEILAGEPSVAARLAGQAARSFSARDQPINAALARATRLRAVLIAGKVTRPDVRSATEVAGVLGAAGWRHDALRARMLTARLALALHDRAKADDQLGLAQGLRTHGTVSDRIELCQVSALLRLENGDGPGAERLLARGMKLLDDYREALGAADLRAGASGLGIELSRCGLQLALESGRPSRVLAWAERLRSNALRLPRVTSAGDPKLRALQAELRQVAAAVREAGEKGRPSGSATTRQARLETAIRARARLVGSSGEAHLASAELGAAARALRERVLVEYVELDGALHALTLVRGRLALHELGPSNALSELEWLRFALVRLARAGLTPPAKAAAIVNAEGSAAALDRLLVAPLLPAVGEAEIVVVPTGPLHAVPWASLPSLRGRPVTVAPSLTLWLELGLRPRSRRRRVAFVAGPRLRNATREVRELAELYARSTVLHGKEATAGATLKAMDGAALAHVACHGHFRADSPLFSSLELADGPLNAYELQSLRHAPEVIVLSACDLAVSDLHPGDELLGFAAALLGMGTRTIVASVVPVPDSTARRLMLDLHRDLLSGKTTAVALAHAQARRRDAGFVCLGSG